MQVSFRLSLPREEASVPITRKLIGRALEVVGVDADTISDVELALTEACANVLRHAGTEDDYEVRAGFDDVSAFLEIIDQGVGFIPAPDGTPAASDEAESGRGVALMKALMDNVRFETHRGNGDGPGDGHSVLLEKRLRFVAGAPMEHLRPVQS